MRSGVGWRGNSSWHSCLGLLVQGVNIEVSVLHVAILAAQNGFVLSVIDVRARLAARRVEGVHGSLGLEMGPGQRER